MTKKGKKIEVVTISDDEARKLWKGKEEVKMEECLNKNNEMILTLNEKLMLSIGGYLEDVLNNDPLASLEEEAFLEKMTQVNNLANLYAQLSAMYSFRYSILYSDNKYKFFKNSIKKLDFYWGIEESRCKKLDKSINNGEASYVI